MQAGGGLPKEEEEISFGMGMFVKSEHFHSQKIKRYFFGNSPTRMIKILVRCFLIKSIRD
jgi:hypothetical protein